jgi:hypothetical protein
MKIDYSNDKDLRAASDALFAWMRSQDIDTKDALIIMGWSLTRLFMREDRSVMENFCRTLQASRDRNAE